MSASSTATNLLLEVASHVDAGGSQTCGAALAHEEPHKFTQGQLIMCLVLRAYLKTTCRGIIEILEVSGALRERMGLRRLPPYSTLKKFADWSEVLHVVDCMLQDIIQQISPDTA